MGAIKSWLNRYASRKMFSLFLLGFSSGLPLALISGTLQAWMRTSNVSLVTIGFASMVSQPYSLKFLWSPIFDLYAPALLSGKRGWILSCQILCMLMLLLMACYNPLTMFKGIPALIILAFTLALCSASQDIVIDGYRVNILEPDERGLGAALSVEGYRVAMIVSGGFALIIADKFGWNFAYMVMSLMMGIGILGTLIAPKEPAIATKPKKGASGFLLLLKQCWNDFFERKNAFLLMALIILYKLSDSMSHALTTPFLIDIGYSLTEIGVFNKSIGMIATLIGVFFGGMVMTRVGLFNSLLFFCILSAFSNATYMLVAIVGKNYSFTPIAIFAESLCGGMGTAALVALVMGICSLQYSSTQFALLTSLTAIGRIYVGPLSGFLSQHFGWQIFYAISIVAAVPAVVLILLLRDNIYAIDKKSAPADNYSSTQLPRGAAAARG